ncbi:hypothetical protein OO013_16880 [Mangrovivirga sp. M17]|uniref:Metallo-beta-lactamase domain-containing protein n=1 Tax=Mangrovivirga halotolerans TaxID=2993936 RepID=A0ABT3RW39_9BACT|nr:hypothetical protein [Mangrovivirga halotolerans]MCX2745558.1 hypothetical protein [Mangrovivirga halotolerans]
MKVHHIRNATMIIEFDDNYLLIDPMLGPKGSLPPFTLFRSKPRKNPTVELPDNAWEIINKTTHCLITHLHPDHLDQSGEKFLKRKNIPVICNTKDEKSLIKKSLRIIKSLKYNEKYSFLDGIIKGIHATHGYGFIAKPMGPVMGFYMNFPNEPSVYLTSDTIYSKEAKQVLLDHKPDISVIAAGTAQFDLFKPLLMKTEDIISFTSDSPGQVIANHLEAVNHCPTTRKKLKEKLKQEKLEIKTWIPEDGESRVYQLKPAI